MCCVGGIRSLRVKDRRCAVIVLYMCVSDS